MCHTFFHVSHLYEYFLSLHSNEKAMKWLRLENTEDRKKPSSYDLIKEYKDRD